MRKYKIKFLALFLITSVAFLSCKKGDPISPKLPVVNTAPSTNNPTLTRGEWKVSLFSKNNVDETNHFIGYVFMFNSNGMITVKKDGGTIEGTWSSLPGTNQKFKIYFTTAPLNELNEDWQIKGETYNDLKLEHASGGNGEMDYLSFKRNQQEEPGKMTK